MPHHQPFPEKEAATAAPHRDRLVQERLRERLLRAEGDMHGSRAPRVPEHMGISDLLNFFFKFFPFPFPIPVPIGKREWKDS